MHIGRLSAANEVTAGRWIRYRIVLDRDSLEWKLRNIYIYIYSQSGTVFPTSVCFREINFCVNLIDDY